MSDGSKRRSNSTLRADRGAKGGWIGGLERDEWRRGISPAVLNLKTWSYVQAAALAMILASAATPFSVQAHGDDGDGPVWTEQQVGPYVVTLWADLHVPSTSVYARIRVDGGDAAPEGTRMSVIAQGPEGQASTADAVRIAGRAGAEGDFDALLPVPVEGEWSVSIHLSGPAGEGEGRFERTARPESSEQWSRAPFLWATALIAAIAAVGAWTLRSKESQA